MCSSDLRKVRVVVAEVVRVDLADLGYLVDFHYCRRLHCHLDRLLQVALGRLVDEAGCVEMLLFLFLLRGSGTVSDCFLRLNRKSGVCPQLFSVRGTRFRFVVTMVPCESKKEWER